MDKSKWFVRVPFELFESPFWMMKPFSKKEAYVDLFKLANASGNSMYETRGVLVTLEEGEVGTSLILLAERWGWDRKTVKRFLVSLDKMGYVDCKFDNIGTKIKLLQWIPKQTIKGTANRTPNAHQMGHQTHTKRDTTNSIYSYNNEERGNKDALRLLELFLGKETAHKPTNHELKTLHSALEHRNLESWKPFMENYHKYIRDGGKAKLLKFFFQEDFRQFEIPHENVHERASRILREIGAEMERKKIKAKE
tara:strand:+ start:131 stop:886 length:756 start_codon:yes stop_codon:yes gene_type:complete